MTGNSKTVAIIGAGISGVVTAAHLKREGLDVTVLNVQALQAACDRTYDERRPIEPTYPSILASKGERKYDKNELTEAVSEAELRKLLHAPPGPCYVGLRNNVATRLLETTLNSFPPGTPDFVSQSVLGDYIKDTAIKTGVHELTKYDTKVTNLTKIGEKWVLEAETINSEPSGAAVSFNTSSSLFDNVVVANGHYHSPRVPDIPNLSIWKRRWPNRIQHSKGYREPTLFKNKNVLLIGASVSSTDIARELAPIANTIYQSHRNGAFDLPASLLPDNAVRVPEVVSFDDISAESEAMLAPEDPIPLTITLKTGQKLCGIHSVILCTGYHITLPFLPSHHSDLTLPSGASATTLITDGLQLHNLHKDIFYIPDPSLLFIGVPYFTATFTLFEFQAMVAAKVVAGKVVLPSQQQMRKDYDEKVRARGYGKEFHSLRGEEEVYVDALNDWANRELEKGGWEDRLVGHSEKWKKAKIEQAERMKELWGGEAVERDIKMTCA